MRIPLWPDLRLSVWERQNPDAVQVAMPNAVLHTPVRRVLSMRGWMLLLIRYDWRKSGRYYQPIPRRTTNDEPVVDTVESLRAKLDEATAALRRVRAVSKDWERRVLPHSEAYRLRVEVRDALAGTRPDPDDDPGPAATQATEPGSWLYAGTRDLSIPQHLPKFTAVHVTPEMEREATERAWQAAEAHEEAEKSLVLAFGGAETNEARCEGCGHHDGEGCGCPLHPSSRAGLHDAIVGALGQIPVIPPVAHRRAQADNVLALLYREWPWLRADAEDALSRADVVRVLTTTRSRIGQQAAPGLEFPDHHQPGETGHVGWCALCARDVDALADALLTLIGKPTPAT